MHRFLSFILLCGILGQASIRTAWTLHYQWNRATYIAQCENKDKPSLHCDGKCAFKKQIAAREKNKSKVPQLPQQFHELKDIQLFFESAEVLAFTNTRCERAVTLPPYQVFLPDEPVEDVFRPPA